MNSKPLNVFNGAARIAMIFVLNLVPGGAQPPAHDHSQMAGHDMSQMTHGATMNDAGMLLMYMASGTGMNPQSWPMPMLAGKAGSWNLMFMGQAYLIDTQQSGP